MIIYQAIILVSFISGFSILDDMAKDKEIDKSELGSWEEFFYRFGFAILLLIISAVVMRLIYKYNEMAWLREFLFNTYFNFDKLIN